MLMKMPWKWLKISSFRWHQESLRFSENTEKKSRKSFAMPMSAQLTEWRTKEIGENWIAKFIVDGINETKERKNVYTENELSNQDDDLMISMTIKNDGNDDVLGLVSSNIFS